MKAYQITASSIKSISDLTAKICFLTGMCFLVVLAVSTSVFADPRLIYRYPASSTSPISTNPTLPLSTTTTTSTYPTQLNGSPDIPYREFLARNREIIAKTPPPSQETINTSISKVLCSD